MQSLTLLTLICLVASAVAAPSQQQQSDQVASSGQHQQAPPSVVQPASSQVEGPAIVQPATVVVSDQQIVHHQQQQHHHQQQQQQQPPQPHQYYSPPAGMITVVGQTQPQAAPVAPSQEVKPQVGVRNYEQYGQPESAGLPPNYKPFGSWGLYIGGNPADGYYTNYYKALSNSVEKQQAGEPVKPVPGAGAGGATGPIAALSPILRQASSTPYVGGDFYSFAYSPSDLNSGVQPQHPVPVHSPVPVSSSAFGAPAPAPSTSSAGDFSGLSYGVSPYADAYATKKVGAAYAQKEVAQKEVQQPASKGYQSRVYVYPSPAVQLASPVGVVPAQHQQQAVGQQHQSVVAYPVPVGSQIVGSQPGVEGAFGPYGVHAFTRYAVKPTFVSQADSSYYYGYPTQQQQQQQYQYQYPSQQHQVVPAYKQQVYTAQQTGAGYYPLSFYGYPLSQLHYSQGSIGPESVGPETPYSSPEQPTSGSGKLDVDEKLLSKPQQQQKRA